jgi:hypothetical protein
VSRRSSSPRDGDTEHGHGRLRRRVEPQIAHSRDRPQPPVGREDRDDRAAEADLRVGRQIDRARDARGGGIDGVEAIRIRVDEQQGVAVLQHVERGRGGLHRAVQLVDLLVEPPTEQRRGVGDPDVTRGEVDILHREPGMQRGERERRGGDREHRGGGDDAPGRQGAPIQRSPSVW